MTVKYEYLVDGTAFTAAEYNTRFSQVFYEVNELPSDSASLGAFRHDHLPCLVGPAGHSESVLSVADGFTSKLELAFREGDTSCVEITAYGDFGTTGELANEIVSCMTGADFPSFQLGHDRADRVGAVLLMGNFLVREWLLQSGTTAYGALNEDALAVQAAFRLEYTSGGIPGQTVILERSVRALSPRLSISLDAATSVLIASGFRTDPSSYAKTQSTFDDSSSAHYCKIEFFDGDDAAVDIQEDFPSLDGADTLWALLNTDDEDDLVFAVITPTSFSDAAPTPVPGTDVKGVRLDKAATLARYEAGDKNAIVAQADDVPNGGLGAWDSMDDEWAWSITAASKYSGGAPLYLDSQTEQDLVLRSVLLPDDLPAGASLDKVTIVALQVGSLAEEGKYKVLVTKGNVTALPLHVRLMT